MQVLAAIFTVSVLDPEPPLIKLGLKLAVVWLGFKVLEYRPSGKMVVADATLRDEMARLALWEMMRRTGLSQPAIEAIRSGKAVRRTTLQRMQAAVRP